jgi:CheY-like chemotaxis protein
VSLRILFADDSMTAQNMGKKILSEAGYDVVAVSNGAAAVKKIAEQKPDIIILDVYMPGYSGLEVCEKVRGSLDTLKTPVLLTVGKMEPYKPEDANRVKADGVIIKPFEASDLLAIVKKFEERIGQMPVPPIVERTVRLEREYQEEAIAAAEPPVEHHSTGKTGMQPMVEVPDHMAGSAAFTDLLGTDSPNATQHFAVNTPAAAFETSVIVPAPPIPAADDEPASWKEEEKAQPMVAAPPQESPSEIVATPVTDVPEPVAAETVPEPEIAASAEAVETEPPHPQFIPVFKEPEPASYEVMHTSAPPTEEMEIPREPALQETAEETTRNTVADHVEPGLIPTIGQQVGAFPTQPEEAEAAHLHMSSAASEAVPAPAIEVAPTESYSPPLPAIDATSEVSDADFEARVAAAMAAYNHAAESAPPPAPAVENGVEVAAEATANHHAAQAVEIPQAAAESAPSFEYHPPVRIPEPVPVAHTAPAPAEVAAEPAPVPPAPEPAVEEPAVVHSALSASVEAAAAAAAAQTGAEHHTIAQAVHRVMERLKPELVEEIMRELKSKK